MLYGIQAGQSVVLDRGAKLRVMAGHVLKAAKRVFGIPDFHYYAIAGGLMSIFLRYPGKLFQVLCVKPGRGLLFLSAKFLGELLLDLILDRFLHYCDILLLGIRILYSVFKR